MTYVKNRSPTPFTVHESTVTPFQAWNHSIQPTIDHLTYSAELIMFLTRAEFFPGWLQKHGTDTLSDMKDDISIVSMIPLVKLFLSEGM